MTGYERKKVLPMLAPSVLIGPARVWMLPKLAGMRSNVLHLSLEHTF